MPELQPFFHLPTATPAPIPAGILDPPRTPAANPVDDEFEGEQLSGKWIRTGIATEESYNDKIRSALYMRFAASAASVFLAQQINIGGDFTLTLCASGEISAATHFFQILIGDTPALANAVFIDAVYSSGAKLRTSKIVATVNTAVDTTATLTFDLARDLTLLHIQRSGNNWTFYYSQDGVVWTKFATTVALTFAVGYLRIAGGPLAATRNQVAFHWFRKDWLTIT